MPSYLRSKDGVRQDFRHIQHSHVSPLADAVGICNGGMDLTQIADDGSVINDVGLSARMQERFACFRIVMSLFSSCRSCPENSSTTPFMV